MASEGTAGTPNGGMKIRFELLEWPTKAAWSVT